MLLPLRLMLLPFLFMVLADVIAKYISCGGRCYCQVADVIATAGWMMVLWLMLLPWVIVLF